MRKKDDRGEVMIKSTIKAEIQKAIIILVSISLIALGVVSCFLNYFSTQNTLKQSMLVTADLASQRVYYQLKATMNIVDVIGSIARLTNESVDVSVKKDLVTEYQNTYDWLSTDVINDQGISIFDSSVNVSQDEFFQKALKGESNISDPEYNEEGQLVVTVASPLWKDGLINTTVVGAVLATIDGKSLSDVVTAIKVSENGGAYMLSSNGLTIACDDYELVKTGSIAIEEAKTDRSMKKLAAIETRMINGEEGFATYSDDGVSTFIAFTPMDINGWSIAIEAPIFDFLSATITAIIITVLILAVALVIATTMARRIGHAIGAPVSECASRLQLLAEGDLDSGVPHLETKNETKILIDATETIVNQMHDIIGDTANMLHEMAGGNFTVETQIGVDAYVGSFKQIIISLNKLNEDLNLTLKDIQEASQQVESGSLQLAESAQSLAEGATDQASSIEELLATITEVNNDVKANQNATAEADGKAKTVAEEAQISHGKMFDLTEAMKKIQETSTQISHIIEGIEDIASQTNLLSLNASIEAARAGEAGRGFAVVADQIGKLAEQSAASATNTRELIEMSIQEVEAGGVMTQDTAGSLDKVMEGIESILASMNNVKYYSDKQAEEMHEIEEGVEQIAHVVENNSATAEETSATSEELSAQSESLNNLISQFRLS